MDDRCTVLLFMARSTLSPEAKGPPGHAGMFACPASRPDPLAFLDEVLVREGLARVQTGDPMTFTLAQDWGRFEELKGQMRERGYGLRMMAMPPRA